MPEFIFKPSLRGIHASLAVLTFIFIEAKNFANSKFSLAQSHEAAGISTVYP
jgi:hypothetical protein